MSTVDNNQSLNAILDKLGIRETEQKTRADGSSLGQEDFLKLMTNGKHSTAESIVNKYYRTFIAASLN